MVRLLISSQIFNATENFWILPNFILCRSRVVNLIFESNLQHRSKFFWILSNFILCWFGVVKTLIFEPNFQRDRKFLDFATFHHPHVLNGQKCQFWAKFLTRIKISSLAGQGWSNSWFQVKFTTQLKISGLCQIPSFAGLEWSKISFLSQIFNATENFLILPNFYLCMSWVVKSLKFCAKFSTRLKISEFCQLLSFACSEYFWAKFVISGFCQTSSLQVRRGQKSHFEPNFPTPLNFFWFCQILSYAGAEGLKI